MGGVVTGDRQTLAGDVADLVDHAERVAARAEEVKRLRGDEGRLLGRDVRDRLAAAEAAIGRILAASESERDTLAAEIERLAGPPGSRARGL
jgi:hypothetical protein